MVVRQFIKLFHSLQDGILSQIVWHKKIKCPLKLSMTYSFSGKMHIKGMEIKQNILNFQDVN